MKTVEICTNNEWLEVFSHIDFEDNNDIDVFIASLANELTRAGFEVYSACGQRATCHGWNGANTFQHLNGPVGSFDDLTSDECACIQECIDIAQETLCKDYFNEDN